MIKLNESILSLTPSSADAKSCNFYIDGSDLVVESITDYLTRIPQSLRVLGMIVIVIKGATSDTVRISLETLNTAITEYAISYYRFEGGTSNVDFKEWTVITSLDGYVKTLDLPNFDQYLTSDDLPDLSPYAKSIDIPSIAGLAHSSDIPNVSEFITAADIPTAPDLSGFATKAEIPSIAGLAKTSDIPAPIKIDWSAEPTAENGISNRPTLVEIGVGSGKASDDAGVVHKAGVEEITGAKTFKDTVNVNVQGKPAGVFEAMGPDSSAVVGMSDNAPIVATNVNPTPGVNTGIVIADHTPSRPPAVGNGLAIVTDMSVLETDNNIGASWINTVWRRIIKNEESSFFELALRRLGVITKVAEITEDSVIITKSAKFTDIGDLQATNMLGIDANGNLSKLPLAIGNTNSEYVVYVNNESELIIAFAIAKEEGLLGRTARIMVTSDITFTDNRQLINLYGAPSIKIECIQQRKFIIGDFIIDFNNITISRVTFDTTRSDYYFRVVGSSCILELCAWITDAADGASKIRNMILLDPITNGTGKIVLRGVTHFTSDPNTNNNLLVQPFWIENRTTWGNGNNLYIEILEMSSVSSFDRFSRVLLTSTIDNCPFKVSGDESWFYAPEQFLPGSGNISALASIRRSTAIDALKIPTFNNSVVATKILGIDSDGRITTNTAALLNSGGAAGIQSVYTMMLPNAETVAARCALSVEGSNYPLGWTIDADESSSANLKVTHNMNRHIGNVTIYGVYADGNQLLIGNLAYAGILETNADQFKILALATMPRPLMIYLTFN